MIRCERATVERSGQVVVESVSLGVAPGHATAIVGRSGAGKSSLLAAVATAVPLHAGDIVVDGRSVRSQPDLVRRIVGYVPDRLPEWADVRAGEFLELFATAAGLAGPRLAAAVDRGLTLAGLQREGHRALESLAAGEAKRLLVGRALLHDPQVLVLDDPFAGLDHDGVAEVARLVGDAHLMGRTVLAAVDSGQVPGCFTHVAVLREGRLVAHGPADPAAFATGRSWRHRIECPGHAEAAVRELGARGVDAAVLDGSLLTCVHEPARGPFAELIAALVGAGIPVASAAFDPPWPAQLCDDR
jgi:ABC-2 type transport system ATP-binding protein